MLTKRVILFLMFVIFFSYSPVVFAGLVINEIMYDPKDSDSGHEWVEVYNNDSSLALDLSKWYFFTDNTKHSLSSQSSAFIPANGYAVIVQDPVKFAIDWPSFPGLVFDSSWGDLNNTTGENIALKDSDLNLVSEILYNPSLGANGDGNSLQKISGLWTGAIPSPGTVNEITVTPPSPPPTGGSTASSISPIIDTKPKIVEIPKIKTQIMSKIFGFVGIPVILEAKTLGYSGEILRYGKYFWNFGDGDSKEIQLTDSIQFTHTFFYPGEYTLSLYYYSNPYIYKDIPDAADQIIIKIIGADVVISNVGNEKDFFVEITNNTDYNADISNWVLKSDAKSFVIPRNTILASKKKMIISPKITNFSILDKNSLKLMTASGEMAFDYSGALSPVVAVKTPPNPPLVKGRAQGEVYLENPIVSSAVENLPALAINSSAGEEETKSSNSLPFIPIAYIIFIGAGAGAVYYIRQKRVVAKVGDDFEILDE